MTHLEIVKAECVKANPSIMELGFGCYVEISTAAFLKGKTLEFAPEKSTAIVISYNPGGRLGEDYCGDELYVYSLDWQCTKWFHDTNTEDPEDAEYIKILGREIGIADVLMAILAQDSANRTNVRLEPSGQFMIRRADDTYLLKETWNLSQPLSGQSPECLEFLAGILAKAL